MRTHSTSLSRTTLSGVLLLAVNLVIIATVTSCHRDENQSTARKGPPPPPKVEAYIVRTQPLTLDYVVAGTVLASAQTELHPEMSGRVVTVSLREGAGVRKGDLLVKLFDDDLQAQKKKFMVQQEIAATQERRLRELLAVHGTTQHEADMARLQAESAAADVAMVQAAIEKTEIRAPYNGVIGLCTLAVGAYVTPATVITTIREPGNERLDFALPESASALVRVGTEVTFGTAQGATTGRAVITAFDSRIQEASRTRFVRARITKSASTPVPGSYVSVSVPRSSATQAIVIPSQALIPKAREKNVIKVRDGKAAFVKVVTGVRTASGVEILEGLSAGDTIVTTGLLFVKPGNNVSISTYVSNAP